MGNTELVDKPAKLDKPPLMVHLFCRRCDPKTSLCGRELVGEALPGATVECNVCAELKKTHGIH